MLFIFLLWQFREARRRRGVRYFWANNPSNSPTRKSEALGKTINDQHIVLIDIIDILRRRNGRAVTVGRVVVTAVELVHDQRSSITADILDLRKLGVLDDFTGRVSRV